MNETTAPEPAPPKPGWSELYLKEDYWAIWLGFLLIVIGIAVYFGNRPDGMNVTIAQANSTMQQEADAAPFHTIAWYKASDSKASVKGTSTSLSKSVNAWFVKQGSWTNNPLQAFLYTHDETSTKAVEAQQKYDNTKEAASAALASAQAAENGARTAGFSDDSLNDAATVKIEEWRAAKTAEASAKKKAETSSYSTTPALIGLCIFMMIFFSIGMLGMGKSVPQFCAGFLFVFIIAVLAYTMASQSTMKAYGIGYAAWAILFGMIISNTIGTPKWVMPAVLTEYYIKTGLVILGAEILFGKILSIGIPGIFVAWVVTPIVLVTTYLFGQYVLKITSKTLNITIAADMSVCGVSAAIATAAACNAKKEELTLAVGLSLIFTSIMMIVLPNVILATGMNHILGGAWMGGTIDATGAVAAAGAFLSDKALYVAATIKMIQNILIGIIAFCVAIYWCYKVDREEGKEVSAWEIWFRFPKFVIGFIAASILMTCLYQWLGSDAGYTLIDNGVIRGFTKHFRGWFFCLAFVSIGLATNFRELSKYFAGGKPLILYIVGQTLNLVLTLVMAYIMFFLVFPEITESI